MNLSDFQYDLPEALIAQRPLQDRSASRLLKVNGEQASIEDGSFMDVLDLIHPGDLVVFNDTRVIPARLRGVKESGGKIEVLVERVLDEHRVLAHVRASKSPKPGGRLFLEDRAWAVMEAREGALFQICFEGETPVLEILEAIGHMPLPPYIERQDDTADRDRYQTVFARNPGAVAAPTAGLHFDDALLERLKDNGVNSAYVTLHVGAGTFQPVRVDNLDDHHMHAEWVTVSEEVCQQIQQTRADGGRVVAVGTTVTRSLEAASLSGVCVPFDGDTRLFIRPGFEFHSVDAMITNFHLPESTLLMLVSAFSGYETVMRAYRHAVAQQYRFFSYGDAMFLTPVRP